MTKASKALTSLLHRVGVGRRARVDASKGLVRAHLLTSKAPVRPLAIGAVIPITLLTLLFSAAPALAAGPPEKPLTEPASGETATSAVLHGTLNPKAKSEGGSYQFDYAPAETGGCAGSVAPVSPALALGDLAEKVEETVTGLEPNKEYLFCVEAFSLLAEASEPGTAVPFKTLPAKPTIAVGSESASSATGTGATLAAQIDANAESTSYEFEYSTQGKTGPGEELKGTIVKVAGGSALDGYGDQTASVATLVLTPGTSYFYRVVATNGTGTEVGPVQEFATVPTPTTEPVTPIGASTATFNGTLTPLNATVPTEYYFQYNRGEEALCTNERNTEPAESAGTSPTPVAKAVSTAVTGLEPDQKYTVCLVSKNAFGFEEDLASPPVHFTTKPAPPTIDSETSSGLATEAATIEAVVDPNNQEVTKCDFEYATTKLLVEEEKGTTVPCPAALGGGFEGVGTSVALTGLKPGTPYYYRLVATNATGTTEGTEVEPIKEFTTEPAQPPAIVSEYVTKIQATVATLNATVDPGGAATTCLLEYGVEAGVYPHKLPCVPQQLGAGTSPVLVSAPLTGLTPGTTYHYRVLATNAQSPGGTPGEDRAFTTPRETSATAENCPANAQARAEQPYGQTLPDCRAYELVSPLDKGDLSVEAVDSRASVYEGASGPEAAAVAYISRGSFSEPGQPVPQGANEDSRYISRREAGGWKTQNVTPLQVAYTPSRVAFAELLFTPDLSMGLLLDQNVPLVPGEPAGFNNLYVAGLSSNPASYQTVTNVTPSNATPYGAEVSTEATYPNPVGVSTDLSHVVFQREGNQGEGAYEWTGGKLSFIAAGAGAPGNFDLPEDGDVWHAVSADGLRVFGSGSVTENPEQEPSRLNGQGECIEPGKACVIEYAASQRTTCNVQRIAKEGPGYVCNGDPEPDPHDHNPERNGAPYPAYYRDANAAGTRVFFTSRAELTNDANTGPADNAANLYEYNLETKELSDLTAENPEGAAVLGLVNAGENAGEENSYVYFVANGVLATGENAQNANKETAQPGTCKVEEEETLTGEPTCNLYVAHYIDGKWKTTFVATLAGGLQTGAGFARLDETDWVGYEGGGTSDGDKGPGSHTVRVTPDGTTLAFESERSLTGYDNNPLEPGAGAPGHKCTEGGAALNESHPAVPCREVYLYNAVTGKLVCASCDPSGALPVGPAELGGHEFEEGNGFTPPSVYYLPRNLSENGGRLFFQSPDALVPHDTNNQIDVYEWERVASPAELAKGENSCTSSSPTFSASGDGCVFPISDVAGDFESRFMDASPTGSNIFIATKDQLVPEADADARANVYDVRVGGGFPVTTAPPACNNGDSCKPPVSPQPGVFAAPASATFSGPGNPAPYVAPPPPAVVKPKTKIVKCAKGKKRNKHNQCVKVKTKRKKAKKSSHNKGRK